MKTNIVTVTVSGLPGSGKTLVAQGINDALHKAPFPFDGKVKILYAGADSTQKGIECAAAGADLAVVIQEAAAVAADPQRYTCVSKPGEYELVGTSSGAGTLKGLPVIVYRDVTSGRLFHREPENFMARMKKIPAEPAINHEMLAAMQQARQWIAENSGAETAPAQLHLMDAMIAKVKGGAV